MHILPVVFLLLTAIGSAAQTAIQPDAEQTKILALENAWNCAEETKDSKALETLLDSTLVYIDYDGTMMDEVQFIASVKAGSFPFRRSDQNLLRESDDLRIRVTLRCVLLDGGPGRTSLGGPPFQGYGL